MTGRAPGDERTSRSHGQLSESQDRQCLRCVRAFFRGVTVPAGSWPLADWSWALSFGDHCDGAATMSLANTSRYVQHARTSGQKVSGGMTGVLIPDELESL